MFGMRFSFNPTRDLAFWDYCLGFVFLFFVTSAFVGIWFGIIAYRRRQRGLNVWGDVIRPPLPKEDDAQDNRPKDAR